MTSDCDRYHEHGIKAAARYIAAAQNFPCPPLGQFYHFWPATAPLAFLRMAVMQLWQSIDDLS